jgi:hypothetical protein
MFPLVSQAIARIIPLKRLRWITFGHVHGWCRACTAFGSSILSWTSCFTHRRSWLTWNIPTSTSGFGTGPADIPD